MIDTAGIWSGVDHSNINHLVATLERRLGRNAIKNAMDLKITDNPNDEHIDIEPEDGADSSEEESPNQIFKPGTKGANEKAKTHTYRLGSQRWRGHVHQKLAKGNQPKGRASGDSSSLETNEPTSEEN